MKQIRLIRGIAIAFIAFTLFSCTKSVDKTVQSEQDSAKSVTMTRNLDSTILTVTVNQQVSCYSYADGEAPRPCDVYVEITCELSKPIAAAVMIEMNKIVAVKEEGEGSGTNGMTVAPIALNISPNQSKIVFRTGESSKSANGVTDNYQLGNVSVYHPAQ